MVDDVLVTLVINTPLALLIIYIVYDCYLRRPSKDQVWLDSEDTYFDYPCMLYTPAD